MVNIGIIGLGHWGVNYLRIFHALDDVKIVSCCDTSSENLKKVCSYSGIQLTPNVCNIINNSEIDGVIIATPASTHYKIAGDCLKAGKDVLAEKPLTLNPEEALELCNVAEMKNRILMVGHTFLYNPGIRMIKEYIESDELGQIYYFQATRTHLGLIREDVNVVWDLAPHDVSIFNYLFEALPIGLNAVGTDHLKTNREDVAFINLVYPNNIIGNIHVSWENSNKQRTLNIIGSKARIVFDDINNLERVKLFKKGIQISEDYNNYGEFQLRLRDGDIIVPKINLYEPLKEMCSHFIKCVRDRTRPLTDGVSGYEVVKVISDIEKVMHN